MQKTELLQVPETMDVQELVDEAPRFWFSRRWRVAFLSCIGFLIVTTHRVCIEVAVTGMLNQTAIHGLEDVPTDDMTPYWFPGREHDRSLPSRREVEALTADNVIVVVTPRPSIHAEELSKRSDNSTPLLHFHVCSNASELNILNTSLFTFPKTGYLVWTEVQKQAILDAFYWGDLLIRLPAGFLSQRYGGKRLLGFAILLESLCTAVIPLTASVHYFTVILLRFITGASAGATVPAMNYLLGRWAPPDERCLLLAIANTGSWVSGSVIAIPLSGLLCSYGFDGGWPAAFYIFGGIGMLWCIVWMLLANDSPIQDSRIAIEERDYIISSLIVADSPSEKLPTTMTQTNHKAAFKWSVALTSLPVFALTICHFSHEWAIYILLKVFPIYMKRNLQFDIKQNSVGTLLPGIGFWFVMLASAGAADRLQGYGVLGATHIRKIMNTTGAVVTAAMIVSMMFLDCNHYLGALFIVIIGLSFCGMQYSGALVSHLDIASRYSALIAGATSTIGASVHFVVPALIRLLLMDCTDQDSEQFQWNVLFIATASCHLFTAIVFLLFGSGQSQTNWFVVDPIATGNDVTKSSAEFPLTEKSDEFDYGGHGRINRDFYAPYVGTGYPVMSRTISMAPSTDIDDRLSPHDNYDVTNCIGTGHVPLMTGGDVRDDTKSSNESLNSFVSTASDDIEAFAMQPEVNRGVHTTSSIENSLQADRDLSESVV